MFNLTFFWYSYYIFQLALPLVILWLAWATDKPEENAVKPFWLRAVFAATAVLTALVLSNNLHQLVFRFGAAPVGENLQYSYGFGFYLVQMGCYLPLIAGFILMFYKGRRNIRKANAVFPFALFSLLAVYAALYSKRVPIALESDSTMVTAVFALLFFSSAIRTGIIPVNSKYAALFTRSRLGLVIADSSGAALRLSENARAYNPETVKNAALSYPAPVMPDENTLLFALPITGGYALWHEDITRLNRLHAQMKESVAKLKAANILLAEEEKLKRALQDENEKTRLMTQLEAEIAGHVIRLNTMAEQLENVKDRPKATARLTLLLCYIKRRCNLFFLEKETDNFSLGELAVYIDELAEIAGYSGVKIVLTFAEDTRISVRRATLFYDFCYNIAHWASWFGSCYILAHLSCDGENTVLRFLPSEDARSFSTEKGFLSAIADAGGFYAVKDIDNETAGLSLRFPNGGDHNG